MSTLWFWQGAGLPMGSICSRGGVERAVPRRRRWARVRGVQLKTAACIFPLIAGLLMLQACSFVPRSSFEKEPYSSPLPDTYANSPGDAEAWGGTAVASFAVPWYLRLSGGEDIPDTCDGDPACAVELAARCRWALIAHARALASEEDSLADCAAFATDEVLVTLSVSGGSMRAGMFARAVMRNLQDLGLLQHVDAMSAISGGTVPASLYALSCDTAAECEAYLQKPSEVLIWDSDEIDERMQRDVLAIGTLSVVKPWNLVPYSVTDFSRTDIFADAFANHIFKKGPAVPFDDQHGRTFQELNPLRPNLILGATVMTHPDNDLEEWREKARPSTGSCFYFTLEDFERIGSDLSRYPISNAVAASSAFPGVFYPLVVEDYESEREDEDRRFLHLQDGGIRDQAALSPTTEVLFNLFPDAGREMVYRTPVDFCDVSRGTAGEPDEEPEASLPAWVVRILRGQDYLEAYPERHAAKSAADPALRPRRIINIQIDGAIPTQGLNSESPMAKYDFWDSILQHRKIVEPVNVLLDEQRVLRFSEYMRMRRAVQAANGQNADLTNAELSKADSADNCCYGIVLAVHDFLAAYRKPPGNSAACDEPGFEREWAALRGAGSAGLYAFSVEDTSGCAEGPSERQENYRAILRMGLDYDISDEETAVMEAAAADLILRLREGFCQPIPGKQGEFLFGLSDLPCKSGRTPGSSAVRGESTPIAGPSEKRTGKSRGQPPRG
jgi:predicted acylesterase/phospholipase RssA